MVPYRIASHRIVSKQVACTVLHCLALCCLALHHLALCCLSTCCLSSALRCPLLSIRNPNNVSRTLLRPRISRRSEVSVSQACSHLLCPWWCHNELVTSLSRTDDWRALSLEEPPPHDRYGITAFLPPHPAIQVFCLGASVSCSLPQDSVCNGQVGPKCLAICVPCRQAHHGSTPLFLADSALAQSPGISQSPGTLLLLSLIIAKLVLRHTISGNAPRIHIWARSRDRSVPAC